MVKNFEMLSSPKHCLSRTTWVTFEHKDKLIDITVQKGCTQIIAVLEPHPELEWGWKMDRNSPFRKIRITSWIKNSVNAIT